MLSCDSCMLVADTPLQQTPWAMLLREQHQQRNGSSRLHHPARCSGARPQAGLQVLAASETAPDQTGSRMTQKAAAQRRVRNRRFVSLPPKSPAF